MKRKEKYPEPDRSKFVPNKYVKDPVLREGDIGFFKDVLADGRPYRLESWWQDGYSFVTFFFSSINLEDANPGQILELLRPVLAEAVPEKYRKLEERGMLKIIDDAGKEMYSITFVAGEAE